VAVVAVLVAMTSSARASANGAEIRLDHPTAHDSLPAPSEAIAGWPLSGSIHPAVRSMPREAETSIESVARYLRAHTHGDADRIKALHDWVAVRIAFDADARPSASKKVATPLAVFAERRAVCQGYAMLFKALALASGDQAVYIAGEARVIGSAEPVEHAWNAALVDGHWQLLDITWDAGAFLEGKFVARYGADYLFTPPEVFALTHRPYADGWQLIKKPLTRAEFAGGPLLLPSFYAHGFRLVSTPPFSAAGELEIVLRRMAGGHLSARAQSSWAGKPLDQRCTVDEGDRIVVRCGLAPGQYQVTFFYSSNAAGTYVSIGALPVTITAH
jgi:hypothetical protein